MIIDKITDVYVSIDVNHPQPTVGLKNPALFVAGDTEGIKQYITIDQVEADFESTTETYKAAKTIFDQYPAPEAISIITFAGESVAPAGATVTTPTDVQSQATGDGATVTTGALSGQSAASDAPASGAGKAAYDYFYANWEFALLPKYNKADALAIADVIENGGYDGKGFHLFFAQFGADNAADATDFTKYGRTWKFYHTDTTEFYPAALAAKGAQPDAGKVSWKFVSDLTDVTPEALTATEIKALQDQGFILYVTKAANSNQTDDKNEAGNYIDFIQGLDFVKALTETNLQNMLNQGGKIPFTAQGLNLVDTTLKGGLDQCYNQGIIAPNASGKADYTTNVPGIGSANGPTVADIAARVLRNVQFGYTPSSAINGIHVVGTANSLV